MRSTESLLQEWRLAERAAAAFETLLIEQCIASCDGTAPPPGSAQWEEVRTLRERANRLFDEAMHSALGPSRQPQRLRVHAPGPQRP